MKLQQVRDDLLRHEHMLAAYFSRMAKDSRWLRFVGGMRVGVEILSANMFHVLVIVLLAILVSNPQLRDVGDATLDTKDAAAIKMWVPVALSSIILYLSASVAGMTAAPLVEEICFIRFLDRRVCLFFLREVFPFLLLLVAPLFLYFVSPKAFTWLTTTIVVAAIIAVQAVASITLHLIKRSGTPHRVRALFVNTILVTLLLLFGLAAADIDNSRRFGPLGLLLISLALWAAILNAVYVAMTKWLRIPAIFFLVLATILVFAVQQPQRTVVPAVPTPTESVSQYGYANRSQNNIKAYFKRWLLATAPSDATLPIPIFLVAAEGGGIRAGYWTARTLARLNARTNGNFSRYTFAYSGVSGGSLGIVTYLDATRLHRDNSSRTLEALDAFYERDFLSPVLGRLLLTEPLHLVTGGLLNFPRRDTAFEAALSRDWTNVVGSDLMDNEFGQAARRLASPAGAVPALLLNASMMESGKQVVMSNIAPHQHQPKTDYLFSLEMPFAAPRLTLAEVVHLSARFPIISPPARLATPAYILAASSGNGTLSECNRLLPAPPPCGGWQNRHWGTVVDGGYVDNSGLNSLEDVYDALVQERERASEQEGLLETDPRDRRYLALLQKVSIHVLIIKNAPEHKKSGDSVPPPMHAPYRDEVYVMINTMMKTRTARAEIAAARLDSQVQMDEGRVREPLCWRGREELRGRELLPSIAQARDAKCSRVGDSMHTIDLAEILSDLKKKEETDSGSPCGKNVRLRPPPLGWMLSGSSVLSIRCADDHAGDTTPGDHLGLGRAELYWKEAEQASGARIAATRR